MYEANTEATYGLVRTGKYIRHVEDQFDAEVASVILTVLSLGHCQVGDIVKVCRQGQANGHTESSTSSSAKNHVKGAKSATSRPILSHESIVDSLSQLLNYGLLSRTHASHFRSPADNRHEAIKIFKSPDQSVEQSIDNFPGRTKKQREQQWEQAIQNKLEEWKHGPKADLEASPHCTKGKGKKRQMENTGESRTSKRQRVSSPPKVQGASGWQAINRPQVEITNLLDVCDSRELSNCNSTNCLIGQCSSPCQP